MFLVVVLILGVICAAIAHHKGRSAVGWFFIGFFFGIFGLIMVLVVSDLKQAKDKEAHVEMEQRRLREQLRQERIKTEQLRKFAQARLDIHDRMLDVDTRHIGNLLEQPGKQPALANGDEVFREAVGLDPINIKPKAEKEGKIRTQCPHCKARFKIGEEHIGKKAKCSKCRESFLVVQFIRGKAVGECLSCGRQIPSDEEKDTVGGRIFCRECSDTVRDAFQEREAKSEGWYYRDGDSVLGPFSVEVIRQLAEQGKVDSSTSFWHESLNKWTTASEVGELGIEDWPWQAAK